MCGCLFCWLCLQEISDVHFLRSAQGSGPSWGCCDAGPWAQPGAVGQGWGPARAMCSWVWGRLGPGAGWHHPTDGLPGGGSGLGDLMSRSPVGVPQGKGGCAGVCQDLLPHPHSCPCSPSGCTFWGKRPWSRSRRILWQLGMVLGAPVVISLVAGIAVPVITVGIPIYMGRKVLQGSLASPSSNSPPCLAAPRQTRSALPCPQPAPVLPPPQPFLVRCSVLPSPTHSACSGAGVGERRKGSGSPGLFSRDT